MDEVKSDLVIYLRRPEDLLKEIRVTVTQISEISGKSIRTLFNVMSLLKLVPKIQDAISSGKLPVSQGYIFAANLGSPDFFTIFDEILEMPIRNEKLEKMLIAYKKAKHLPSGAVVGGLPSSVLVGGLPSSVLVGGLPSSVLVGGKSTNQKPIPIKNKVAVLRNTKSYFEKKPG